MKKSKSIRLSDYAISAIEIYRERNGLSFSKAVEDIVENYFFGDRDDFELRKLNKNFSKLKNQNEQIKDFVFSLMEEADKTRRESELLQKMVLLAGIHISSIAEKNLLKEFPDILK